MSEWRKHTGAERPAELAPAQIVDVTFPASWDALVIPSAACKFNWRYVKDYCPVLDPDGLPYVSAEGLEDWAEYVAKDGDAVWQYRRKPRYTESPLEDGTFFRTDDVFEVMTEAPYTHATSGPPENSLARVWRS